MKILFTGSRIWTDKKIVKDVLIKLKEKYKDDLCICEGGAKGLDIISKEIAQSLGIYVFECDALWDYYSKAAGFLRNQAMLSFFIPDIVIGYSKNILESNGTRDCLNRAITMGIKTILINDKGEQKLCTERIKYQY